MSEQVMFLPADEEVTLATLRRHHKESGFKGPCIVMFHPLQYQDIIEVWNFRIIDDYRVTKPMQDGEIGMTEMFHFVPLAPIEYRGCE